MRTEALWSTPADDVATALVNLKAGTCVGIGSGEGTATVRLNEDIRAGHKFSVRPLVDGLRVRKFGEFIGRLTSGVRVLRIDGKLPGDPGYPLQCAGIGEGGCRFPR